MVSVVARNAFLFVVSVVGFVMVSGCYKRAALSPMETIKTRETSGRFPDELSMCIYIYIYYMYTIYIYIYIYTYTYIYILLAYRVV